MLSENEIQIRLDSPARINQVEPTNQCNERALISILLNVKKLVLSLLITDQYKLSLAL